MRLTLYRRFLLVVAPSFVVLSLAGLMLMSRFDTRVGTDALALRVGNLGARVAATLERHSALKHRVLAEDLLGMFGNDPAVECVEARRQADSVKPDATYPPSIGCTGTAPTTTLTLAIDDEGGTLRIAFTDAEIAADARRRGWMTLLFFGCAALTALGSATVGYRLIIGRRLKRLHEAIVKTTESAVPASVDPGAPDELGDIIAAHNELTRRVAQREQAWQERNDQLSDESRRDALTGVYNRRHFEAAISGSDAMHRMRAGAVALIDLDHFKAVNDTHGHLVGDEVLVEIARRLSEALRPTDQLVRWGGEEFLIYAEGTISIEGLARRLHRTLSGRPIMTSSGPLLVTTSIGIVRLPQRAGSFQLSIERLIVMADRALYAAKAAGRHRTVGIEALRVGGIAQLATVEDEIMRAAEAGLVELVMVDGAVAISQAPSAAETADAGSRAAVSEQARTADAALTDSVT